MFDDVSTDIPESSSLIMEEIILKNKGKEKLKPKFMAISYAIMAAVCPQSFSSPFWLVSVFIHKRYGSK